MREAALEEIFGPGGTLERTHPRFEAREGQVEMARAVSRSLDEGRHLLVEAGTGTGKTLAYLIPAALSGLRVIVSTGTRTLQDQILSQDVPFLKERLGLDVTVALMKGRENYLCLRRLDEVEGARLLPLGAPGTKDGPGGREAILGRLRDWAGSTGSGDRAELPDLPDDSPLWASLAARSETCTGARCEQFESCFLTRMKRTASAADLVIVNHHLFFADLALRQDAYGRILPPADRVIFDEAHLIEETATRYFGRQLSSFRFADLASDAAAFLEGKERGSRSGFVRESDLEAGRSAGRRAGRRRTGGPGGISPREPPQAAAVRRAAEDFFDLVFASAGLTARAEGGKPGRRDQAAASREPDGSQPSRLRFDPAAAGPALDGAHETLLSSLAALGATLAPLSARSDEALLLGRRAEDLAGSLRAVLDEAPGLVRWVEPRGRGGLLAATPADVSGPLAEHLFGATAGVVMTSATLAVAGNFDFLRRRIGLGEAWGADAPLELVVSSPFDHARQAALYLPRDMPDPREGNFAARFLDEVLELLDITRGRAFLLFTSFAAMRRARAGLDGRCPWPILIQGEAPKALLVERFRQMPGAVLLGTASFWHGVDVPGEALSLVVIDKLPFDAPGDPLVAARIEAIRAAGGEPFREYQLPSAVIELKQGIGRLIRSRRDRGLLCVTDPRLTGRGYGKTFLSSLPPFTLVRSLGEARSFFEAPGEEDPVDETGSFPAARPS